MVLGRNLCSPVCGSVILCGPITVRYIFSLHSHALFTFQTSTIWCLKRTWPWCWGGTYVPRPMCGSVILCGPITVRYIFSLLSHGLSTFQQSTICTRPRTFPCEQHGIVRQHVTPVECHERTRVAQLTYPTSHRTALDSPHHTRPSANQGL